MKGSLKRILSVVVMSAMILGMCQIMPFAATETVTITETNCNIDNMTNTPDHNTAPNDSWFREAGAGWGWLCGGVYTVDGDKMFQFNGSKVEPRSYTLTKPTEVDDYTMNIAFKLRLTEITDADLVEISLVDDTATGDGTYASDTQSRLVYLDNGNTSLKFTYPTGGNNSLTGATFNEILTPVAGTWYTFDYKVKIVDGITSTVDYTVTPAGGTAVTATNVASHQAIAPDLFRISIKAGTGYTHFDDLAISYTYEKEVADEPVDDGTTTITETNCNIDNMTDTPDHNTAPNDSWFREAGAGWGWLSGGVYTVDGDKMFQFNSSKVEPRSYTLTKPTEVDDYTMNIAFKLRLAEITDADSVEISLVDDTVSGDGTYASDTQSRLVYLDNSNTSLKFTYPTGGNNSLTGATFNEILTPVAGTWYTFDYKVKIVDGITSTVDYTVTPAGGTAVTATNVASHQAIAPDLFRISIKTGTGYTHFDDLAISYTYKKAASDEPVDDGSVTVSETNCDIDNMTETSSHTSVPNDSWFRDTDVGYGWLNGGIFSVDGDKMFRFGTTSKKEVRSYILTKPVGVDDYTMNISFKVMLAEIDSTDLVEISLVKEASTTSHGNDDQSRLVYLDNSNTSLKFTYPTGGDMWLGGATFSEILTPVAETWYTFDYKVNIVNGVTSTVDYTVTPAGGTAVTVANVATHRAVAPDYFRIGMVTNSGYTYLDDLAISYTYIPNPNEVDTLSLIGFDNADIEATAAPSNGFKGFRVVLDQEYEGLTATLKEDSSEAVTLTAATSDNKTYDIALTGYVTAGTSYTLTVNYGEESPYTYTFTPTAENKLLIGSYSFCKADGTAVTADNAITAGETISLKAKIYNATGDAAKTACLLVSVMEDGFLKYTNLAQQTIGTSFDGVEISLTGITASGDGTGDEAWGFLWESVENLAPFGTKIEAGITAAQ